MKLTGRQIQNIRDALVAGYPTLNSLRMMVRIELEEELETIVGGENQRELIFNLVMWADRSGKLDKLITGAYKQNSGNPALQQLARDWRAQVSFGTRSMPSASQANVLRKSEPEVADTQSRSDPKPKTLASAGTGGEISSTTQTRYIAVVIVVAIIVGAYALYQIERSLFPLKPPDPTTSVGSSPPSQAGPVVTPIPYPAPQLLNFVNGIAVVQSTAVFNEAKVYQFYGVQGQHVRIQLASHPAGANFEVASGDRNIIYKSFSDPSLDWSYMLPVSQNYLVTVNSVTAVVYTLTITLAAD